MSIVTVNTGKRKFATAQDRFAAALKFIECPNIPRVGTQAYERTCSQVWRTFGVARMLSRRFAVEEHMRAFKQHARQRFWPSQDAYIADLLREWYAALERHCTLFERVEDESKCNEDCAARHSCIMQLCDRVRAYGCTEHSSVHICDRRTCSARMVTASHNTVCIFSGEVVGTVLGGYDSLNRQFERSGAHGGKFFLSHETGTCSGHMRLTHVFSFSIANFFYRHGKKSRCFETSFNWNTGAENR